MRGTRALAAALAAALLAAAPAAGQTDAEAWPSGLDADATSGDDAARCAALTWLVGRTAKAAPPRTLQTLSFLNEAFMVMLDERAFAEGARRPSPDEPPAPLPATRAAVEAAAERYAATLRGGDLPDGRESPDAFLKADLAACAEMLGREAEAAEGSDGAVAR